MITMPKLRQKKQRNEPIVMVTCYDATSARLVEKSDADCILVGDSVAMVMHGFESTTHATMAMMETHTQAVARKAHAKLIVSDLPFLSYRGSLTETMDNVRRLIQAGAQAVKLEGAKGNLETISHIVGSGVPVVGHLGLTPQSINALGGFKVQGRDEKQAQAIIDDAKALEKAGVSMLVLECVPSVLAKEITEMLSIPTIGIGAGNAVDGQVLVWQDMLGMDLSFAPKFLKHFATLEHDIVKALNQYAEEVKARAYPENEAHGYS